MLACVSNKLDASLIFNQLDTPVQQWIRQVEVLAEVDSTNEFLKTNPSCSLLVAERQLAGRGQKGRCWYSPEGQNIYLSVRWLAQVTQDISPLTRLVVESIQALCNGLAIENLAIKFPNDLMIAGKKVAGVLVEATTQGDEVDLIIGIGINVWMQSAPDQLIEQPWTSLVHEIILPAEEASYLLNRNYLISCLLNILYYKLVGFSRIC